LKDSATIRDYDEALGFYIDKLRFEKPEDTDLGGGTHGEGRHVTVDLMPLGLAEADLGGVDAEHASACSTPERKLIACER
jgi:hypothetical protein